MESITVIRFWENLIEDIKKKNLFYSIDSYSLDMIYKFELFADVSWTLKHIVIQVVWWCLTILFGFKVLKIWS